MSSRKQYQLSDLADVLLSNVDKKSKINEKEIRLCNYTDVYKNSFINYNKSREFMIATCNEHEYVKFRLKKGQVAITKDSETPDDIGVSTYISDDFEDVVLGYHLSLITPYTKKLDGGFLHYWLNTKQAKKYFENNAGGSGQRYSLSLECIKSIPLHIPDLQTQESISKVLFALDAKIELNNHINSKLEAMAKTIYDYWFIQFDFPDENGKPYKSFGGKMVYSKELKREIPEGWKAKNILSIADLFGGGTPKTKEQSYWNGRIPFFTPTDAEKNIFIVNTAETITELGLKNSSTKLFPKGTIFLTARGSVGNIMVTSSPTAMNQSCYALVPLPNINYQYVYFATLDLVNYLKIKSSGSVFKSIVTNDIRFTYSLIPPVELIKRFEDVVTSQLELILKNLKENQQLTQLRDWLLPMLMNGQVTVKDAEDLIDENTMDPKAAEPKEVY